MENIINIYKNYGVLAAEKRAIYTYGMPHTYAVCHEEMSVEIPEGWELCENEYGEKLVTSPWGLNYLVNEVLNGDGAPIFRAVDDCGRVYLRGLKIIREDEGDGSSRDV